VIPSARAILIDDHLAAINFQYLLRNTRTPPKGPGKCRSFEDAATILRGRFARTVLRGRSYRPPAGIPRWMFRHRFSQIVAR
jgi:hypothetical protein